MIIRLTFAYLLMIMGAFFAIVTVIGLIRFPDVYTRIHAGAVVLTISAVLVCVGSAIYVWDFLLSLKILLVGGFFLFSNPMATHAIAKASYKRGIALPVEKTIDEYSTYLRRDSE